MGPTLCPHRLRPYRQPLRNLLHLPAPPLPSPDSKMTRSQHKTKEAMHNLKTSYSGSKKHGHGTANWGSEQDDILEGIALARSPDFVSHSPAEMGAQKLSMSPPTSPSLATTAERELKATDDGPETVA